MLRPGFTVVGPTTKWKVPIREQDRDCTTASTDVGHAHTGHRRKRERRRRQRPARGVLAVPLTAYAAIPPTPLHGKTMLDSDPAGAIAAFASWQHSTLREYLLPSRRGKRPLPGNSDAGTRRATSARCRDAIVVEEASDGRRSYRRQHGRDRCRWHPRNRRHRADDRVELLGGAHHRAGGPDRLRRLCERQVVLSTVGLAAAAGDDHLAPVAQS